MRHETPQPLSGGYLGDKATDRIEWEHETDLSGDTDYLERDWSAIEIEQWIDEAAEEPIEVDEFFKRSRMEKR